MMMRRFFPIAIALPESPAPHFIDVQGSLVKDDFRPLTPGGSVSMGKNYFRDPSAPKMIGLMALVILAVCSDIAVAQPAVSSVTGTMAQGQVLVISGTSFGAKSTPAPLTWENFNDGVLSSSLTPHGTIIYNNADNLRHQFALKNARADFKVPGPGSTGHFFEYGGSTAPQWFVQYWVKLASNWHWGAGTSTSSDAGLSNVKFFRLFPTGSRGYSNVGFAMAGWESGAVHRFVETASPDTYLAGDAWAWFTLNVWHNVQVQYSENSGVDQNNGTLRLWIDGVPRDSTTTLNTNVGSNGTAVNKRPYIIGFFDAWPTSAATPMYAYYSDIYVDNTWARVEIGDASTYAASRHLEVQIPTAWANGSITTTINQGSFAVGSTAYLYVIDSSGQANTNGFPIVTGGSGGGTAPLAPTGLRIVR